MGAITPRLPFLLLIFLTSLPFAQCQNSTAASATADVANITSDPLRSPTSNITSTSLSSPTSTITPTSLSSPTSTITPTLTTASPATTTVVPSTSTRAITLTGPPLRNSTSNSSLDSVDAQTPAPAPGCGPGLAPIYFNLCDKQAAWGIVVESLASLGFVLSVGLLLGLLLWSLVVSLLLFLLGTAGLFALTFAFVVHLTPRTCPTRLFLFGVLSALCFSALLARCLALLGFGVARGWAEPVVVVVLTAVQVIIAVEWLLMVLVRDGLPCSYSQAEFAMLLIYVLCLLAAALVLAARLVWRTRRAYGYSYRHTAAWSRAGHTQATLLLLTVLLAAAVWVVWIALLTRGNPEMGRRPAWDDPVLSVALVASGWVMLLGHGVSQLAVLCRREARTKGSTLDFT
ncbi:G-protein coupled receptor family C group 5 member D, partial [Clupea harengus]|uniref:G-protein coupled receptor family C group 5 member D n=1 Tax=Clupea harengus TaxID=7950 RepID=A0A8M1KT91_CLUHA